MNISDVYYEWKIQVGASFYSRRKHQGNVIWFEWDDGYSKVSKNKAEILDAKFRQTLRQKLPDR